MILPSRGWGDKWFQTITAKCLPQLNRAIISPFFFSLCCVCLCVGGWHRSKALRQWQRRQIWEEDAQKLVGSLSPCQVLGSGGCQHPVEWWGAHSESRPPRSQVWRLCPADYSPVSPSSAFSIPLFPRSLLLKRGSFAPLQPLRSMKAGKRWLIDGDDF